MVAVRQREHRQYFPRPGWVEHDPMEIWANTQRTAAQVLGDIGAGGDVVALGIANQRETTVVWDRDTGRAGLRAPGWQGSPPSPGPAPPAGRCCAPWCGRTPAPPTWSGSWPPGRTPRWSSSAPAWRS